MARRATFFKDVYQSDAPTLKIAGGFEFTHRAGPQPGAELLEAMARAYVFLGYDAALLTRREAAAFEEAGVVPPAPWATYEQSACRELVLENGKKVEVVVFPPLPKDSDMPDDGTFAKIARSVRQARKKGDLVIGLCDWGIVAEREYLARKPKDAPHLLFGSGSGTGIRGQVMLDGRLLYVRSYDKGKAINQVEILKWPQEGDFVWIPSENVLSTLVVLDNRYYDSLKIEKIFSNVDLSNN
nr:hypothetical protein [Salidesulfovibrio onnuriiensis]